jgi:hypothetical protein
MHPLYTALLAEQRQNDLLSEAEAARNARATNRRSFRTWLARKHES